MLNEYPQAIWEVDCEGEIPLHAAASWGSVGSVFSLLVGAGENDNHAFAKAALKYDDRRKTPLDRACERLISMSMAREPPRVNTNSNLRQSLIRDDPFDTSNSLDEGRESLQRSSSQRGRRRIPGCGSSFRSSLSSSFVLGRGDSLTDVGEQLLRDSFVSPRRQVDPIYGLELLDSDGLEELAKIELLARAGYGFFETKMYNNDNFQLLHAVIALGCSPEIVWHVCATKKHQLEEKDEFGRSPLLLAFERLGSLYSQQHQSSKALTGMGESLHVQVYTNEEATNIGNEESMDEACCSVVESLLTGGNLLKNSHNVSESPTTQQPQLQRSQESSNVDEVDSEDSSDNNIKEQLSLSNEVISILLKSSLFGRPNMASVANLDFRLPMHIILEAGVLWVDNDDDITEGDSDRQSSSNVVQLLVEVCPHALEIKDGTSGLYPFMIAAIAKDTSESEVEEEDTKQLETIFQLLLKAPNTISLCTENV